MLRAQNAGLVWLAAFLIATPVLAARRVKSTPPAKRAQAILDDSTILRPAADLKLSPEGEHQAEALARFVEGVNLEEEGEMERALASYQQALNLDPGEVDLAVRVATMLARNDNYPDAIDVLKDAVKAKPNAPEPYRQLAFIYAKYLHRMDQAVTYADKAITLDPKDIDGYQRLFEIELAAGNDARARDVLQRAAKIETDDATFWLKLGRLFSNLTVRPDAKPNAEQIAQLNEFYHKAAAKAQDNATVLKETADFFGATDQVKEALPLYLRVLELQPDDASVRQKVAAAFVATNQRAKAIATLEAIIKEHPERYQSYELLAQLHDEEGRALARDKKEDAARAEFKKAAQGYEQCLLINPSRGVIILRLAELLLGALQQSDRAVPLLADARRNFPNAPEFDYYYAIALREAKKPKEAVVAFQEALNEAANADAQFLNARFYLDYGAAAEEAALYDKAAELFRKAISLDPENAAPAYNYLGYMWAEQNSHLDEAEDAVKRALKADPGNGAYLDSMAWVQYRQGKFERALESAQSAIKNLPKEDPVVYEHLGDIYAKMNRGGEALEAWQKAHALDPANKDIAEKIESQKTKVSANKPGASRP